MNVLTDTTADVEVMGHVLKTAEALDKYGFMIIGAACFIVIALIVFLLIIKAFMKQSSMANCQNQKVFDVLMDRAFGGGVEGGRSLVKESIDCTGAIIEHLKYTAATTKADRIAVYVFHNGQRMLNGRHMMKFSCMCEYATLQRYYFMDKQRDIPVGAIQMACNELIENHRWSCADISTLEDGNMQNWFKEFPSKSVYLSAVYDTSGIIIGFVSANFFLDQVTENNSARIKEQITRLADRVSVAVDLNLIERSSDKSD